MYINSNEIYYYCLQLNIFFNNPTMKNLVLKMHKNAQNKKQIVGPSINLLINCFY